MRFTIQDVRAEVGPDNSTGLGGLDPEHQASNGTTWTWVGVRALTEELRQAREEIQELRQEILETRDAVAATQETVEEIGEWIRVKPDEEKRPWWARLLKR